MLYQYKDSKGNKRLIDAPNRVAAANHIASTEYELDKVNASEAVRMRDEGVEVVRVTPPEGKKSN